MACVALQRGCAKGGRRPSTVTFTTTVSEFRVRTVIFTRFAVFQISSHIGALKGSLQSPAPVSEISCQPPSFVGLRLLHTSQERMLLASWNAEGKAHGRADEWLLQEPNLIHEWFRWMLLPMGALGTERNLCWQRWVLFLIYAVGTEHHCSAARKALPNRTASAK